MSKSLPRFRTFSAIIYLNSLSTPFSLSYSSTSVMCIFFHLIISHNHIKLFTFFFLFFLLWLDNFKWPVFDFTDSFFCLIKSAFNGLYYIFQFSFLHCILQFQAAKTKLSKWEYNKPKAFSQFHRATPHYPSANVCTCCTWGTHWELAMGCECVWVSYRVLGVPIDQLWECKNDVSLVVTWAGLLMESAKWSVGSMSFWCPLRAQTALLPAPLHS